MDTTAAAELLEAFGGGIDGVGFGELRAVDPDQWDDDADELEDGTYWDTGGYGGAVSERQSFGKGRGRHPPSGAEVSGKRLRTMPDGNQSNGGSNQSYCGNQGSGSGRERGGNAGTFPLGRANGGGGSGGEGFGPGSSTPGGPGAGAVGRGRGLGSIFYKTKLCSRFRSGNCPYSTNCNFAHGMEELRKPPPGWEEFVASQELPPPLPSQSPGRGGSGGPGGSTDSQVRFHKTRPCKKYFGEGNCPYGEKCNFLHDEQSVPRVVREAREAAVAAVAGVPKFESPTAAANGNTKEAGSSTPAASGNLTSRPPNWKTRLCNKWDTTGHCPFGDTCHFAHGSDELQRYGGGMMDANVSTPTLSDSKSGGTPSRDTGGVSPLHTNGLSQRPPKGAFTVRESSKKNHHWRGPTEITTIYGDWLEEDKWESGVTITAQDGYEHDGNGGRAAERYSTPSSSAPQIVPFFRSNNGKELFRQIGSHTDGFTSAPRQDGGVDLQSSHCEPANGFIEKGLHECMFDSDQGWG